jgi:hypothetical protein
MTPPTAAGSEPLVDGVGTAVYTVPTDAPEGDGTLAWDSTTMVVVQVSGGGTTGLGYTYGAAATARIVEQQLAGVVTGRCAWDVPAANEAMNQTVRNAGRPGLIAGAVSAVDIALWDLKARLLDLPLTRLLGASRTAVPVYGSGGFTTYDQHQQDRQLRHWVEEQDIPRVKIKVGESWGRAEPSRTPRRMRCAPTNTGNAPRTTRDWTRLCCCPRYADCSRPTTRALAPPSVPTPRTSPATTTPTASGTSNVRWRRRKAPSCSAAS